MTKQPWWKGSNGEWYVFVQMLLFGLLFITPFLLDTAPWPAPLNRIAQIVGILLGVGGVVMALWGVASLGENITAVPKPKTSAKMVKHGAYRIVRHPIYSGIILAGFGWSLLNTSFPTLILAVVLFLFFDLKSRKEETWLTKKYHNYATYQQEVRKLLPFIY